VNKVSRKTKSSLVKGQKRGIILVIVVVVYIVSMFFPVIGGFTAYPVAMIRCGKPPVITSNFAGSYNELGTKGYSGPNILSVYKNYVCSASEAESQGFRRAPW